MPLTNDELNQKVNEKIQENWKLTISNNEKEEEEDKDNEYEEKCEIKVNFIKFKLVSAARTWISRAGGYWCLYGKS